MPSRLLTLVVILFTTLHALAGVPLSGSWHGAVTRDGSVQLLDVDFSTGGDSLTATYHLPDLGLYEEAAELRMISDSTFIIKIFMGEFSCIFHETHSEITGENTKWKPVGLKLHLKKGAAKKPHYTKEEVQVAAWGRC